jgi:hypothetical protein
MFCNLIKTDAIQYLCFCENCLIALLSRREMVYLKGCIVKRQIDLKVIFIGVIMLMIAATGFGETRTEVDQTSLEGAASISGETDIEGQDDMKLIFEIAPASFLFSSAIDGFSVTNGTVTETVDGTGSWIPNARGGLRFYLFDNELDLTAGVGYLYNEAATAPFYTLDLALNFDLSDTFTISPHVGYISIDNLEWEESADVSFSDASGLMAGVKFNFELNDATKLFLSVDYIEAESDVTTGSGWTANSTTYDQSGLAIQFGVGWKF